MVSKLAQSSIALFLAKSAFAMKGAKRKPEFEMVDEGEPPARRHEVPPYKIVGAKSIYYSMKNVYRSETPDGCSRTGAEEIKDFYESVIKNITGLTEFDKRLEDQTLIIGWGGMCWPVDGRGATMKSEDKYKFPIYTERDADVKDLEVGEMLRAPAVANCEALNSILEDHPEHKECCFKGLDATKSGEYYKQIGNVRYTIVNKLSGKKPEWAAVHKEMAEADYRVDVGTGKAAATIKKPQKDCTNPTNRKDKWSGRLKLGTKGKDLADRLYDMPVEEIQKVLEEKANAMYEIFLDAYNKRCMIKTRGKPTAAFGLTGKWRINGDSKKQQIFEIFQKCIHDAFENGEVPVPCTCTVEEVSGTQEAVLGTESLLNLRSRRDRTGTTLWEHLRAQKVRFLVSLESGNGSTQIGVVDLMNDCQVDWAMEHALQAFTSETQPKLSC